MSLLDDTIVAISTPLGFSGLGIVRLSGKDSFKIAEEIFVPKNKSKILSHLKTFTTHLGYIVEDGKVIDEVLVTIMRAPHSYTCEDVVEFSCHGGVWVLKKVLELCVKKGARIAEPGEFTKRAFLNGRIDLTQAEAVCDLIFSQSEIQNQIFVNSLLGKTKQNIQKIIKDIEEIMAVINLGIEYPQEDDSQNIDYLCVSRDIMRVKEEISVLIENSKKITPILTGINLAIVGKVNVGKSSLLNMLLSYDRAIVSEIPGTTRDTISETINLNGLPIRIVDTAGIRQHQQDIIEKIGMERTKDAIKQADIILFVLDGSIEIDENDFLVAEFISEEVKKVNNKIVLLVINKNDKPLKIFDNFNKFKDLYKKVFFRDIKDPTEINKEAVFISCLRKEGIRDLQQKISDIFDISKKLNTQDVNEGVFVTNLRQLDILEKVYLYVSNSLTKELPKEAEIVAEDLRNALVELKKIIGIDITEDVLEIIFSRFCVGK
ncbi:MAG: tRNA uridine-5-carboxymethylaminomethyl(34) synthesis GTPase MnmE [Elusimicrobiota bacterium]|nr:tRNA uridine-5-carboxymethylaminomethyl(34) synthesis GTPase MnmE [Endomicrobiia bacterium]MDW8165044.1 tRNA uridine-5-carboxymethylaminomethyl(34) synthesis GTPase MnmE [Elusimicrobiota bacterium]